MTHVVGVIDSHTIVVDADGRRSTVALGGVTVDSTEEDAAAAYLHQLVDHTWVYVENGSVYRSPDGLFVNGEMQRRAWRAVAGMRYLGEAIPGPLRAKAAPSAATPTQARTRAGKSRTPAGAKHRKAPRAKRTS